MASHGNLVQPPATGCPLMLGGTLKRMQCAPPSTPHLARPSLAWAPSPRPPTTRRTRAPTGMLPPTEPALPEPGRPEAPASSKGRLAALAGNRTRVNCLEGSYAHHYTTNATRPREPLRAGPGLPSGAPTSSCHRRLVSRRGPEPALRGEASAGRLRVFSPPATQPVHFGREPLSTRTRGAAVGLWRQKLRARRKARMPGDGDGV